ncbi:MAG: hypothetical protein EA373_04525 [Oceanospirillales bacterium]|nr:MAG: hypothetical protein EA373_04525 [Oceanospirillales bacterium]
MSSQKAVPAIKKKVDSPFKWKGEVPRFSRFREGGPGRPLSLLILAIIGLLLILGGNSLMESKGITSSGPALILFGFCVLGFVMIWVFIKTLLRKRDVTFIVDSKGVAIRPSPQQRKLDKWLFWASMFQFWMTWRGGIWTPWVPVTRWKEVRRVEYDDEAREILVRGGEWDIRLMCTAENYEAVREAVKIGAGLCE